MQYLENFFGVNSPQYGWFILSYQYFNNKVRKFCIFSNQL